MSKQSRSCPACGSREVVPILYGLPDVEAFEAEQAGKLVLGGCVVGSDDPEWHCKHCATQWGRLDRLRELLQAARVDCSDARAAVRLRERYRRTLLGVAVGNALGLPVEGASRESIRRQFPGGLREVSELERARPWDDDVAQTIILAEGLRSSGELDIAALERELVRWQHENGRGIGSLTAEVIRAMRNASSPGEAAQQVWERGGRRAAGNGAVMRCAPVGLRWRRSPSDLIAQTRRSTVVTHYDPRCEWSAVALNAALARALADTPTDLAALAAALDAAEAPAEVGAAVRAVPGCTLDDLALDGPSMGYTLKAMQVGLWCLEQPPDFEDVLVAVIHAGGDTDTNGAVAGAIMGSRLGVGGIPHRWLANVRDTDRIVELADALFEAAEQS